MEIGRGRLGKTDEWSQGGSKTFCRHTQKLKLREIKERGKIFYWEKIFWEQKIFFVSKFYFGAENKIGVFGEIIFGDKNDFSQKVQKNKKK